MKIFEYSVITLCLIGIAMSAAQLSGGDELFMVGLLVLSGFYFFLGFAIFNNIPLGKIFKGTSYETISKARIFGGIALGIAISSELMAALYKLLHLTGAGNLGVLGGFGSIIILTVAVIAFFVKRKTMDYFYKNVFLRGALTLACFYATFLISSVTYVKFFHRSDPKYIELYENMIANPMDERAWGEFDDYKNQKK